MTETGARYAIVVDAANVLKTLRPYMRVVVRDLQTGQEIDPQKA